MHVLTLCDDVDAYRPTHVVTTYYVLRYQAYDLLHATEHIYIPSALRHQVVSASESKRAKFQKRSTEAGSELVGESKATLVGESKARSMSPSQPSACVSSKLPSRRW